MLTIFATGAALGLGAAIGFGINAWLSSSKIADLHDENWNSSRRTISFAGRMAV